VRGGPGGRAASAASASAFAAAFARHATAASAASLATWGGEVWIRGQAFLAAWKAAGPGARVFRDGIAPAPLDNGQAAAALVRLGLAPVAGSPGADDLAGLEPAKPANAAAAADAPPSPGGLCRVLVRVEVEPQERLRWRATAVATGPGWADVGLGGGRGAAEWTARVVAAALGGAV